MHSDDTHTCGHSDSSHIVLRLLLVVVDIPLYNSGNLMAPNIPNLICHNTIKIYSSQTELNSDIAGVYATLSLVDYSTCELLLAMTLCNSYYSMKWLEGFIFCGSVLF